MVIKRLTARSQRNSNRPRQQMSSWRALVPTSPSPVWPPSMSHPLSSSSGPPSSSGGVAAGPVVPAAAAVVAAVAVPAGTVPTAAVAVAPNEFPIHPVNVLHASMHRHMQQQMQAAAARSLHLSQTPGPSEQSAPEATNRPVPNELIQSFANQGVLLAQSILSGMPPQGYGMPGVPPPVGGSPLAAAAAVSAPPVGGLVYPSMPMPLNPWDWNPYAAIFGAEDFTSMFPPAKPKGKRGRPRKRPLTPVPHRSLQEEEDVPVQTGGIPIEVKREAGMEAAAASHEAEDAIAPGDLSRDVSRDSLGLSATPMRRVTSMQDPDWADPNPPPPPPPQPKTEVFAESVPSLVPVQPVPPEVIQVSPEPAFAVAAAPAAASSSEDVTMEPAPPTEPVPPTPPKPFYPVVEPTPVAPLPYFGEIPALPPMNMSDIAAQPAAMPMPFNYDAMEFIGGGRMDDEEYESRPLSPPPDFAASAAASTSSKKRAGKRASTAAKGNTAARGRGKAAQSIDSTSDAALTPAAAATPTAVPTRSGRVSRVPQPPRPAAELVTPSAAAAATPRKSRAKQPAVEAPSQEEEDDGRIRVAGEVFVPVTFTIIGERMKQKLAAKKPQVKSEHRPPPPVHVAFDALRHVRRVGGSSLIPSLSYPPLPPVKEPPPALGARSRWGSDWFGGREKEGRKGSGKTPATSASKSAAAARSGSKAAAAGQTGRARRKVAADPKLYTEDADPALRAAILASLGPQSTVPDLQPLKKRGGRAKKPITKREDEDGDVEMQDASEGEEASEQSSSASSPTESEAEDDADRSDGSTTKPKRRGRGRKFAQKGDDGPPPVFDREKPRQEMYDFAKRAAVQMDTLPAAYRTPTYIEIIAQVRAWMTKLGLGSSKLAQELGVGVPTAHQLITNAYKGDLSSHSARMRHFLWCTDQWAVGRTKQYCAKLDERMADVGIAAPQLDVPPRPEAVLDAKITDADWEAWFDFTLPIAQREAIDTAMWPMIEKLERPYLSVYKYQESKYRQRKRAAATDQAGAAAAAKPSNDDSATDDEEKNAAETESDSNGSQSSSRNSLRDGHKRSSSAKKAKTYTAYRASQRPLPPIRGLESASVTPVPTFHESKTRQSLYILNAHPPLDLTTLPQSYQREHFTSIMECIKKWMGRLGLNSTKLCQEMQCSNSTIYFLLTNTYKYDLTNYNTRVRHYLWRTDQWACGRMRQYCRQLAEKEAAEKGQPAVEVASADKLSANAAAALAPPPRPTAVEAEITAAEWSSWFDFTMSVPERAKIDDVVHPLIQQLEDDLVEQHHYEGIKQKQKQRFDYVEGEDPAAGDSAAGPARSSTGRPMRRARAHKVVMNPDESEPDEEDEDGKKKKKTTSAKKRKSTKGAEQDEDDDFKMSDGGEKSSDSSASEEPSGSSSGGSEEEASDGEALGSLRASRRRHPPSSSKKPRVSRTTFDIPMCCKYPVEMPHEVAIRASSALAHSVFEDPAWSTDEVPLESVMHLASLVQKHLPAPFAPTLTFVANSDRHEMAAFDAMSFATEQRATLTIKNRTLYCDAVINVSMPISSMAWCPIGGAAHSPLDSPQYLAVAIDHNQPHLRLGQPGGSPGLITLFAIDLSSPDAPRAVLSLTHAHGNCIAMAWYPHSVETFPAEADAISRLGVLAVIFNDGTAQVRAIPKIPLETEGVQYIDLDLLPGAALVLPSTLTKQERAIYPTSLCWSSAPQSALVAVGLSDGRACVYDVEWSTSSLELEYHPTSILSAGHSMISGVCFHPRTSHLLALCTCVGEALVFDLRSPWMPQARAGGSSYEGYRGVHWPIVAHPTQECLILSQVNEMRVVPLSLHSPFTSADKAFGTMEVTPVKQIPLHEHAVMMQFAVGVQESASDPLMLATANSDGTANLFGINLEKLSTGVGASIGLTRTSFPRGDEDEEEKDDPDPNLCILAISNSYPAEKHVGREVILAQRKARAEMKQVKKYGCVLTPQALATDSTHEMHAVAINPNISFPRMVASAGVAGLIRLQMTKAI